VFCNQSLENFQRIYVMNLQIRLLTYSRILWVGKMLRQALLQASCEEWPKLPFAELRESVVLL
jgi:hypothetical protein